jgi:energy-coupling factor transporter ATP-binding protein EcfA2
MVSYIILENVHYTYPGRTQPAVWGVNLILEKGEKIALTGLNGSGKSTLAKIILGLLKPQQGRVLLDDQPLDRYTLPEIGARLGFVAQDPGQMLFNLTVGGEIAFGLKWRGQSREQTKELTNHYLQRFGLWYLRDANPFHLSEGQKQMVVICAILALAPAYLILDEPTKSLDTLRKKDLQKVLQHIWSRGTGIILVSHDSEFVAGFGGRSIQLIKGEVAAG